MFEAVYVQIFQTDGFNSNIRYLDDLFPNILFITSFTTVCPQERSLIKLTQAIKSGLDL